MASDLKKGKSERRIISQLNFVMILLNIFSYRRKISLSNNVLLFQIKVPVISLMGEKLV